MAFNPLYIFFVLFIVAAYIYYTKKKTRQDEFFRMRRKQYLEEHQGLDSEKIEALEHGHPWIGMDTEILKDLFGEPYRQRPMNSDASETIWSYGRIYVLVDDNRVKTWSNR